jgi:hypothetical protein
MYADRHKLGSNMIKKAEERKEHDDRVGSPWINKMIGLPFYSPEIGRQNDYTIHGALLQVASQE